MNKIEQALLNADDLAISEEVDCSDVLWYIRELNKEKEQVRKDTAKEILQQLVEWNNRETLLMEDIQELATKYDIEVDE